MGPALAAAQGDAGREPAAPWLTRWPPIDPIEAVPLKGYGFRGSHCEGPDCIKPTPYPQYRRRLIGAGYMPVKMTPPYYDYSVPEEWRKKYPEFLSCWGTDRTACQLVFLDRSKRYVIVETLGQPERFTAVAMGRAGPKQLPAIRAHGG